MEFIKNEMINQTLDEYFNTWQHTQDTSDFVDEKFLKKIDKYIFRDMVKKFKQIEIFHLLILRDRGVKLGLFDKLKILFSSCTAIYNAEKKNLERKKVVKRKKTGDCKSE